MISKLLRLACVGSLLCATGVHWAALQSLAWARMAALNAREAPLGEALARTFDGRHLCDLCKTIQKAGSSQSGLAVRASSPRLDLHAAPPPAAPAVLAPVARLGDARAPAEPSVLFPPSTPPPKPTLS